MAKRKRRSQRQIVQEKLEKLGGADWILEKIASGATEQDIQREIGCKSRFVFFKAKKAFDIPKEALRAARREHARRLADESGEILDSLEGEEKLTTMQVNLARARADNRLKRAAMWNSEEFGRRQSTQVDVNLSLSGVFIQALSDMSAEELAPADRVEVGPGEVKQLESGGG